MYSDPCVQAGKGSVKVAVLDTIHGAGVIAQRMAESGIQADALDVYHHSPSIAKFDLVVSPVHLWPGNPVLSEARRLGKKIITHHKAVGELLAPSFRVFEITGTHSKTTTALLLAMILSVKNKVVSHSTRGIELWSGGSSKSLLEGLSIAPANAIKAVEAAEAQKADALVCEISLGGTGLADYGILTSFSGDYRIAQGTKWASTAKLQMISLAKEGARTVANTDIKITSDISFGPKGDVRAAPGKIYFGAESVGLELSEDLDFSSYETAISAASAAASLAEMSVDEISNALEGFSGFSGRLKVTQEGGFAVYDNSNSGLKVSDVNRAMDHAFGGRLGLVVGEEAETVCEGMDVDGLVELLRLRRDEIVLLVLVGKRLESWAKELEAEVARDLASGIELARSRKGIERLLLCVKCFR